MIVRMLDATSAPPLAQSAPAPDGLGGRFASLDVLEFTSAELDEAFGIRLAQFDARTAFELAALLEGGETGLRCAIRKDLLVRLIEARRDLLPCFVGFQHVGGGRSVAFMTDGPCGKWSLFFDEDGRMTLVERRGDRFDVVGDGELRLMAAERAPRQPARRAVPLLLARLQDALGPFTSRAPASR